MRSTRSRPGLTWTSSRWEWIRTAPFRRMIYCPMAAFYGRASGTTLNSCRKACQPTLCACEEGFAAKEILTTISRVRAVESTTLSDFDLYLIAEGTHNRAYERMGAHIVERGGRTGVEFAVWARNGGL